MRLQGSKAFIVLIFEQKMHFASIKWSLFAMTSGLHSSPPHASRYDDADGGRLQDTHADATLTMLTVAAGALMQQQFATWLHPHAVRK